MVAFHIWFVRCILIGFCLYFLRLIIYTFLYLLKLQLQYFDLFFKALIFIIQLLPFRICLFFFLFLFNHQARSAAMICYGLSCFSTLTRLTYVAKLYFIAYSFQMLFQFESCTRSVELNSLTAIIRALQTFVT